MTDEKTPAKEGSTDKGVEGGEGNAPALEALQATNTELSDKFDKLTTQFEAQGNSHQAELRKLRKEAEANNEPAKEDSTRIADLELRLARSEAVAEFGLDSEDVAIFRGTPDEIKEQAAHFASKLSKSTETTSEGDLPKDPKDPKDPPVIPPKPKGKELTNLQRYQRGTAEERRVMMEKASRGDLDLAK